MSRPTIDPARRSFVRDGEPWFFLADTAWSATTNPTDDEWNRYLDRRAAQGFTAVQINLLPQWDRSAAPVAVQPFAARGKGYDGAAISDEYLSLVDARLAAVAARGLVPAVVLLWCNYVPGTWASARRPHDVIPRDALDHWLETSIGIARRHGSIYLVSGDTDFATPEAIDYYRAGLEAVGRLDPGALATLHVAGGLAEIPDALLGQPELSFLTFQSGHGDGWDRCVELAGALRSLDERRPVVNAEPCYEGHLVARGALRFSAREVRRVAWQSLLCGASAGITYGAHGIWSWHRHGLDFAAVDFSGLPFAWDEALEFRGADDYAFARALFEQWNLFGAEPLAIEGVLPDVAAATSSDGSVVAVFTPAGLDVPVSEELAARRWIRIDLQTRAVDRVRPTLIAGLPRLPKGHRNTDSLSIGT